MGKSESMGFIGILMTVFITIIIGLALFTGGIASNVGEATNLQTVVNDTVTSAASGSAIDLSGKYVTDFIAINATDGVVIPESNYTVLNSQVINGELTARLQSNAGEFDGLDWNVSYTTQPDGYISSGGARTMANLITVMTALAIAMVGLYLVGASKLKELAGI